MTELSENTLKVEVEGYDAYYLDLENISIQQGIVIQSRMGMSIEKLFARFSDLVGGEDGKDGGEDGKDNLDLLKIVHCFWWLMRAQSGIREPIADCDGPLFGILGALLKGMADSGLVSEEDAAAAVAADPTPPSPPAADPSPGPSAPKAPKPRSRPVPAPTG